MDDQSRMNLLKANIGALGSTIYDDLLISLLNSAVFMIGREGIALDLNNTEDNNLVVGYATWLFQQREQPDMEMPRWLRYNLNNKLFAQKAGAVNG